MIKTPISIFDLDQTLFTVNSSYRFGIFLHQKKVLSLRDLLFIIGCNVRTKLGLLSLQQLHEMAFKKLFFQRSAPLIMEMVDQFLETHFEKLIYRPAYNQLQQAKEKGHGIIILSSSPDFLVGPIAKRFRADRWQSTVYSFDKNQRFSKISQLMQGEDKAVYVRNLLADYGLNQKDVTAYSDSHLDLPFLQAAGHAVGVNPNKKLLAICKQNQWSII